PRLRPLSGGRGQALAARVRATEAAEVAGGVRGAGDEEAHAGLGGRRRRSRGRRSRGIVVATGRGQQGHEGRREEGTDLHRGRSLRGTVSPILNTRGGGRAGQPCRKLADVLQGRE